MKSPPELWADCSDASSLNRHLNGAFGEIRITALEPETRVVWEGEDVSGTVTLEPSGWGTRVILTVRSLGPLADEPPTQEAEPHGEPRPEHRPEHRPEPGREPRPLPPAADGLPVRSRRGWFTRLLALMLVPAPLEPSPQAMPEQGTEPLAVALPTAIHSEPVEPEAREEADDHPAAQALREALDSLGQAHHRPFSRA